MNTNSPSSPFHSAVVAAREFGLHTMTLPVFAKVDPALCLFAENILITEHDKAGFRYGSHFVLATPCGTRAVPIIPMRLFSRPCVPTAEDLGSTMPEIITSLRLAAPKIQCSVFDLRGAVVAARKQTSDRGSHLNGCRILLNHEIALYVSPHSTPDPPAAAARPRIILPHASGIVSGCRGLSAA